VSGTDERLRCGKTPNFALLYQQSPAGFYRYGLEQMGVRWTEDEAAAVHAQWHDLYPGVRRAWNRIVIRQHRERSLTSPSGRTRRWAILNRRAERQGTNFLVQATAAELCHCAAIVAMTQSEIPALGCELILTVHDSLIFLVPASALTPVAQLVYTAMTSGAKTYFTEQFGCSVPLALRVDIAAGPSWGDATPVLSHTPEEVPDEPA
jgi:DNA polymerase I-like protein with 3'-5' exonuclease and polymerase domains